MPVGFTSASRNLFLLGSVGSDTVTNFFKSVDQSTLTDGVWIPNGIRYNSSDQKYILSGTASDSNSQQFGWLEKRNYDGETGNSTADFQARFQTSTNSNVNTTLRDIELDGYDKLIVVGKSGTTPWIAKYTNSGVVDWISGTNTGEVEYTGITSDSNGKYYACGSSPVGSLSDRMAFVEAFDANGNPSWGKTAQMVGRDVVLNRIAANSRGEVVAVGHLEDDSKTKGYIIKIDTNTGEVMWDRTLENNIIEFFVNRPTLCEDVYIDTNDNIYVVGRLFDVNTCMGFITKYTAEGNMLWQRQTTATKNTEFYAVNANGETGDSIVFGSYYDNVLNDRFGMVTKYRSNGDIAWRRTIKSTEDNSDSFGQAGGQGVAMDADPSFIYLLFVDSAISGLSGTPDKYTFGKVSSSGNGLGGFTYTDGSGESLDYEINDLEDQVGQLYDGSVRNDTSDFVTYPYRANKIMFDDLATPVANKRRQMDDKDSFEYSGSPAIRVTDFQELNLLGDVAPIPGTPTTTSTTITETWSSYVSNGSTGDRAPSTAFNGSIANNTGYSETNWTRSASNGNTPAVLDVSSIALMGSVTEVKVYAYVADSQNNGTILAVNDVNQATSGQSGFQVYTVDVSGTGLETIKYKYISGSGPYCYLTGVTVSINGGSHIELIDGTAISGNISSTGPETWQDQSGKGNDGDVVGATHNAAGYWEFDGTDDSMIIGTLGYDYSKLITLEAWVYPVSSSGNWNQIVCGEAGDVLWAIDPVNRLNFGSQTNTPIPHDHPSGDQIPMSAWIHLMTTYDGAKVKHYINGKFNVEYNQTGSLNHNEGTHPLRIGSRGNGAGEFFNGKIGEVRIYPRALTAAQAFQNYNASKPKYLNLAPEVGARVGGVVSDSNLILNYDFGNRVCYDDTQNLLKDNFTDGTDTGEYYTDEIGVRHKIYTKDANMNQFFGDSDTFTAGSYDLMFSMYVDLTDATSFDVRPEDFIGAPITGTIVSDIPALGSKGMMTLQYSNIQPTSNWVFAVKGTGTAKFARPFLEFKYNHGRYVKTYGSAIPAPTTVKNLANDFSSVQVTATPVEATFDSYGYFELNETDSAINLGPATNCSGPNVTFEMWFEPKTTAQTDSKSIILSANYEGAAWQDGTVLLRYDQEPFGTARMFIAQLTTGTTNEFWQHSTQYPRDNWYHVVWTWNNGTMKLYVNGSEKTLDTNTGGPTSGSILNNVGDIYIGENDTFGSTVIGNYAQVRIYTKTLSATEVSENFNATRGKYGV